MGSRTSSPEPRIQLSRTDRQILALLKQDARRSVSEMAATIGLSRQTVKDRMTMTQERGVIRRFTVEVDDRQQIASYAESAFFLIRLKRAVCRVVFASIRDWPELFGCWSIAGDLDMVVLINAASNSEIERLRDTLARHPEVHRLQTLTVLRDWIARSQSEHPKAQALLNDYLGLQAGDMVRM